jgi:hypothetical protein
MTLLPDSPPCRDAIENMIKSVNLAYSAFLGVHPEFKVNKPASLQARIPTPALANLRPGRLYMICARVAHQVPPQGSVSVTANRTAGTTFYDILRSRAAELSFQVRSELKVECVFSIIFRTFFAVFHRLSVLIESSRDWTNAIF